MIFPPSDPFETSPQQPVDGAGTGRHGAGTGRTGATGCRPAAAARGGDRAASSPGARRRLAAGAAAVTGVLALTGCGSTVTVEGAPHASDPACASVMLAMPADVSDMAQRETSSQGTTAYGDPSAMIVRCGVEPPGPTTNPCTNVNGVDWLISEVPDEKNQWRAVTYGRSPATEILFDGERVPSSTALVDAGSAVQNVPQTGKCQSVKDTLEQQGQS